VIPPRLRTPLRSLVLLCLPVIAGALLTPAHAAPARRHAPAAVEPAAGRDYAARDEVRAFIDAMVQAHGFDAEHLSRVFRAARFDADVLRLIGPPRAGFKRSWEVYRARFLDPLRIREGVRFWRTHEDALKRASAEYGVPAEIIVSIIGVETIYGRITGDFRVLDALTTLAFDYPRRAAYFREELEHFLLYTRDAGLDLFEVRGSFAGAIGLPQFMPGSLRRFAVDFDGDGRIDLRGSPVDAIGSVARFLSLHGWVPGEPTHFPATIAAEERIEPLIAAGIEPQFTLAQLADYGVGSPSDVPADAKLALIDLQNAGRATDYVLGARNFYAVTRYNRSSFYAMAVIELARTLSKARDG